MDGYYPRSRLSKNNLISVTAMAERKVKIS